MPLLILMDAAGNARQILLRPGRNTIGRSARNDIVIDSRRASRSHAVIVYEGAFSTITDLHSLNGTLVNGELIVSQLLANGDGIQIGTVDIRFVESNRELPAVQALRILTAPTLGESEITVWPSKPGGLAG
ncbi:FHA domain-containing protein [Variovorax sp. J22R133]|uniref:FHA domain-containing protein n=1 Tax=Variovorax brevis TaxID=3053503 RepID=UPI002576BEFD|nr:FHA domain-containing protein [Variovorax sp. J22R133]MDM0110664.1 FHA domain-containing protein [Variovorax sp. J22R133]